MTDLAIKFTDDDEELLSVPQEALQQVPEVRSPVPGAVTSGAVIPAPVTSISVVTTPSGPAAPTQPGIFPAFEKAKVSTSEIKISGACSIDTHGDLSVCLDDLIRAVGVFRVTKVNHYVNKAGEVVRQQVLSPVEELVVVPFDASNAADDGIVRARP